MTPQRGWVPHWWIGMLRGNGAALGVGVVLACYADLDGVAFPSVQTIADEIGYSKRAVFTALATLEGKGLIVRIGGRGRGKTTTYRLNRTKDELHFTLNGSKRPEKMNHAASFK